MKKALWGATALTLAASTSFAGGLDRSGQGINILFEEGTVGQFSYSWANPSITGTLAGTDSGDIGKSYSIPGLAFKSSLTDTLDVAVIYDQPFGAHIGYASNYFLSSVNPAAPDSLSLSAEADTHALTALLRHKFDGGFSVYGGLRVQTMSADVNVPIVGGYSSTTDSPTDIGWSLGGAWEKPEIAARVALTYNSGIKHKLSVTETNLGTSVTNDVTVETPQSLNLDFQSGVAANTLVFGTVRWANWSDVVYAPPLYTATHPTNDALVSYDDDVLTYSLGIGHRFTDAFSGALSLGYERSTGKPTSNLGPTDGYFSVGLGGTYTRGNTKYSAGVRWIDIGDATTTSGASFSGNEAWAIGFQVTHQFN